jgi:type I restriction enzyme R subunit
VYELDIDGNQLSVVRLTDYAGETVRTLYPNAVELRQWWCDPRKRGEIIQALAERGIEFSSLAEAANQPEADPFDLLCYLAYNAPLRTCRERADRVRLEEIAFFEYYSPAARHILEELLEKYAEFGTTEFRLPDTLQVPPMTEHGNVQEIAALFGGALELKGALEQLQSLIYK